MSHVNGVIRTFKWKQICLRVLVPSTLEQTWIANQDKYIHTNILLKCSSNPSNFFVTLIHALANVCMFYLCSSLLYLRALVCPTQTVWQYWHICWYILFKRRHGLSGRVPWMQSLLKQHTNHGKSTTIFSKTGERILNIKVSCFEDTLMWFTEIQNLLSVIVNWNVSMICFNHLQMWVWNVLSAFPNLLSCALFQPRADQS